MKIYNCFLFSLLLAVVFSCGKSNIEKPEIPENLISESKMVEILYDMSLLSAAKGVNKKLLENKGVHPKEFVYNKYEIDSVQFAESNAYYSFDIRVYQSIYAKVKERLETDKKDFNTIIEQEKKSRDSINAINKKADSIKKRVMKERKKSNEEVNLSKKTVKPLIQKQ